MKHSLESVSADRKVLTVVSEDATEGWIVGALVAFLEGLGSHENDLR